MYTTALSWDNQRQIGLCEFEFQQLKFAPGPSHLTLRSTTDSAILRLGSTPWNILEGFTTGTGLSESARTEQQQSHIEEQSLIEEQSIEEMPEADGITSAQIASTALLYDNLLPYVIN